MFSLDEKTVRRLLEECLPAFQATEQATANLGLGFLYYGFVRSMRPENVVVVGSKKGFSVMCMALGLRDNEGHGIAKIACYETSRASTSPGHLHFIDPSYSVERGDENHMYGIGFWDDPAAVKAWWARFGVGSFVTHHKCRSDEFLRGSACPPEVDLVLADGDHTPEGILRDVEIAATRLRPGGLILVHDVDPRCRLKGGDGFDALDSTRFEKFRLPIYPGLAIIQRRGSMPQPIIDPR